MLIKEYKPYTPSRRFMTGYDFSEITTTKPHKPLTKMLGSTGGRNSAGRVTSRFRWWGHKKLYRIVDFRGYDKLNIPAKISTIEYDPYRNVRIALATFADGEKRYVLARKGIKVGDAIMTWDAAIIQSGNRKQLKNIPEWVNVYNLEVTPFTKGKLIKWAGNYGVIMGRDEALWVTFVKLPSGQLRKFNDNCWATIGELGNEIHKNIVIGKAGRQRWLGKKPHVLGLSMNPVDHPHGWWEWHTGSGLKHRKAFNGRVVDPGKKTRRSGKWSDRFIVQSMNKI